MVGYLSDSLASCYTYFISFLYFKFHFDFWFLLAVHENPTCFLIMPECIKSCFNCFTTLSSYNPVGQTIPHVSKVSKAIFTQVILECLLSLPARRYPSAGLCNSNVSVCLSVTRRYCQNEES